MPDTVDDLLETLHGPISQQLREREGKRLSVKMSKPHVKTGSVGPKPEDNADVHPGELHHEDLNRTEREQVESGGHIKGLEDD